MKTYYPLSAISDIFFRNSSTANDVAELQTIKYSRCSYQRPNSYGKVRTKVPRYSMELFKLHFPKAKIFTASELTSKSSKCNIFHHSLVANSLVANLAKF